MNFTNFSPENAELIYSGMVAKIFHQQHEQGTYEYVVLPDTVRVIPVTLEGKILVTKEKVHSSPDAFYSLPGGTVDPNETPEVAALRELAEETGYSAKELKLWFSLNPSQTVMSTKHIFIAQGCEPTKQPSLEVTEQVVVELVDLAEFISICAREDFKHLELQNMILKILLKGKRNATHELSELFGLR